MRSMEMIVGYTHPNLYINTYLRRVWLSYNRKQQKPLQYNIIGKEYSYEKKSVIRIHFALQTLKNLNEHNTFFSNSPKDIDRLEIILDLIPATDVYLYDVEYSHMIKNYSDKVWKIFLQKCNDLMLSINNEQKLPLFYEFISVLITLNCYKKKSNRKVYFNENVQICYFNPNEIPSNLYTFQFS